MGRASAEFERTVNLDPRHVQAYLFLAGARDSLRDTDRARAAAEAAVKIRSDSPEAALILASLSGRSNLPRDRVRAEFQRAVTLNPNSAAAHLEFARWVLDAGSGARDRALAMDHACRAIALGTQDSTAYLTLGRTRVYGGDYSGAIEPLSRAASLSNDDPAPALALAEAYGGLRRTQQAEIWRRHYLERQHIAMERSQFMQAIAVAPHDLARKAVFAQWLGRNGDIDDCVRYYALALRSPVDSPRVLVAASRALLHGGHAAAASALCTRAGMPVYNNPNTRNPLTTVGRVTLSGESAPDAVMR